MTDVLEVVGLCCLVVAGFALALWVGLFALGVACLVVSFGITRKRRLAVEVERVRKAALAAR